MAIKYGPPSVYVSPYSITRKKTFFLFHLLVEPLPTKSSRITSCFYRDGRSYLRCMYAAALCPFNKRLSHISRIAGDLNYVDPSSGETVVYNLGDIAWTLASTALVWLMIPGLGFFYSGLLRRKNALSMIWTSMMSIAVVSFQVRLSIFYHGSHTQTIISGSSGDTRWLSAIRGVCSLAT